MTEHKTTISPSLLYRTDGVGKPRCDDCGEALTEEERHYYEHRCEGCERAALSRYQAWRHGAPDAELDALYSVPPRRADA